MAPVDTITDDDIGRLERELYEAMQRRNQARGLPNPPSYTSLLDSVRALVDVHYDYLDLLSDDPSAYREHQIEYNRYQTDIAAAEGRPVQEVDLLTVEDIPEAESDEE